jgi:uncharacterized hydrophobic protein (TIGR00271 family)
MSSPKSFPFKTIIKDLKLFFQDRFNLHEDEASEKATIADIKGDIAFRGANLWILIFAILVCSVGLDINSTAVVIGAMLISPLMGPIMGVGLGIGIYDIALIGGALKNLAIAVILSVLTSALYFWISPLDVAKSELLARTSPTLWDVFIALFGGLAGIIASSRKEKSNAIPGVAIATALMPPLCTAGFGIATAQWTYVMGAMYLFFINSVFISVSTYLIVLLLGYSKKEFVDAKREKKVKRYILLFVIVTIVPSIYTAYNVVLETLFTKNANNFIHHELTFENTQVISSKLVFDNETKRIEVTFFGEPIDSLEIETRKQKLEKYNLAQTELVVRQGYQREKDIDLATIEQLNLQLKTGIIEELYKKNEDLLKSKNDQIKLLENEIIRYRSEEIPINDLTKEIKAFTKNISQLSVASAIISDIDSITYDTVHLAYVQFKSKPRKSDLTQIEDWLKARLKIEKVKLIYQPN